MTNLINKGFVKKIENINEALSYVTLIAPEGGEPRIPFCGILNEKNYEGKPVVITLNNSEEMSYSHIKEVDSSFKEIKLQYENPFLHSNNEIKFLCPIEIGEVLINASNKKEEIYQAKKFPKSGIVRFSTLEKISDGMEFHRFYKMRNNNPKTLVKISQRPYDREFRIGLGERAMIPEGE
ncbi:MAG: hypothetical protein Q8Q86_02240 [Candidatus Daviesbacteria bacterium]|nr:hypothetical protein [Candidatus Daviesbacteria bacterium]